MPITERSEAQATPRKRGITRNTIILVAILLVVSFLAGFLPTYAKVLGLEKELRAAQQENSSLQLRDISSLLYLQAIQKDFGLAADTSTRFFDRVQAVAGRTSDPGDKALLEEILVHRDKITSELARGSPEAMSELHTLVVSTRAATARSTGALPAR
jgi:hypothetical protein